MSRTLLYPKLLFACALISQGIQAAPCGSEITGSCSITKSDPGRGPLFTIKPGAKGQLDISGKHEALYRGSVLRFEGDSSGLTVNIREDATLTSDYDTIKITEGATTGNIVIGGSVSSKYQSALSTGPGSDFGKIVLEETGSISNQSPDFSTIKIDATSTGELEIKGKAESAENNILLLSKAANHLWYPASVPESERYKADSQKIVFVPSDKLSIKSKKNIVAFGDPTHDSVTIMPPTYNLDEEGSVLISKTGQEPDITLVDSIFTTTKVDATSIPGLSTIRFVRKPDAEISKALEAYNLFEQQRQVIINSEKYAPDDIKAIIYSNLASDTTFNAAPQTALLETARQLTPNLPHINTLVMDMARHTSTLIDARIANSHNEGSGTGRNFGGQNDDRNFWAQAGGSKADLSGSNEDAGYETDIYRFTIGYDQYLPESTHLLGGVFSYQKSDADLKRGNNIKTDAFQIGIYGDFDLMPLGLEPLLLYSNAKHDDERSSSGSKNKATYHSNVYMGQLLSRWYTGVHSLAGVRVIHVKTDQYSFKGLGQSIKEDDLTAFEVGAGVRYFLPYQAVTTKFQLMAWYNFNDDPLETRYTIGESPTLKVTSDRDTEHLSLSGQLGFDYSSGQKTYGCDATGLFRKDFHEIGIGCRFRYDF